MKRCTKCGQTGHYAPRCKALFLDLAKPYRRASRQYVTQRLNIADGRCATCGKGPLETATHCAGCAEKVRARAAWARKKYGREVIA